MPDVAEEVIKARRFLKERLQRDYTTLRGYEAERTNVRQLLQRTAEMGESNSLLLIGPRGAGKTTVSGVGKTMPNQFYLPLSLTCSSLMPCSRIYWRINRL